MAHEASSVAVVASAITAIATFAAAVVAGFFARRAATKASDLALRLRSLEVAQTYEAARHARLQQANEEVVDAMSMPLHKPDDAAKLARGEPIDRDAIRGNLTRRAERVEDAYRRIRPLLDRHHVERVDAALEASVALQVEAVTDAIEHGGASLGSEDAIIDSFSAIAQLVLDAIMDQMTAIRGAASLGTRPQTQRPQTQHDS